MKPIYVKLPVLCRTGVRDAKGFERQYLPQLCQSRLNDQMEGTSVASLVLECSERRPVAGCYCPKVLDISSLKMSPALGFYSPMYL